MMPLDASHEYQHGAECVHDTDQLTRSKAKRTGMTIKSVFDRSYRIRQEIDLGPKQQTNLHQNTSTSINHEIESKAHEASPPYLITSRICCAPRWRHSIRQRIRGAAFASPRVNRKSRKWKAWRSRMFKPKRHIYKQTDTGSQGSFDTTGSNMELNR